MASNIFNNRYSQKGYSYRLRVGSILFGLLLTLSIPSLSQGNAGYLLISQGSAMLVNESEPDVFLEVKDKDFFSDRQTIITDDQSKLILKFRDGSSIKMFSNTSLTLNYLTEVAGRRFNLDFDLDYGTMTVAISRHIKNLSANISTYTVTEISDACFSASNDPDLGLVRIKAADVGFDISEGLASNLIKSRQIYVRFEKAFDFTSKSITTLHQAIRITTDKQLSSSLAVSVQLTDLSNSQYIKRQASLHLLSILNIIFDQDYMNLDQNGYLFLNVPILDMNNPILEQSLTCFEIDDPTALFLFATGVLRGTNAVEY